MPVIGKVAGSSVKAFGGGGSVYATPGGRVAFTTIGTTSWPVPAGTKNIRAIVVGGAGGGGFVTCCTNAGTMPGGYGGYSETNNSVSPGQVISITVGAGGIGPSRNTGQSGGTSSISISGGLSVTATGGGGGYFIYGPNVGHAGVDGSASGGSYYNGTSQSPPRPWSWESSYTTYGKPNAYGDGSQGVVVIEYYY